MDQILGNLGELFVGALPSAILLLLLYFYLRVVLFAPLEKILAERHSKTGGREQQAEKTLKLAETKLHDYAQAIQAAKVDIYAGQEKLRKELEASRDKAIADASASARAHVASLKEQLQREVEVAQQTVETEAKSLAQLITQKVLAGGVS